MLRIENETLVASFAHKGAELKSLYHKAHSLHYLWDGNPAVWGKTSPVLFPIVGTLKNGAYSYRGRRYQLPRHGFARDREFAVTNQSVDTVCFALASDAGTLTVYPFQFLFSIEYRLSGNSLSVCYRVENRDTETLPFSVGGHPAFKLPLAEGVGYDDYRLLFPAPQTAPRWPISAEGLIEETPLPLLQHTTELPLHKALFQKDAVVLKDLTVRSVQLQSDKSARGLAFHFDGFPYLGLWAAPGADFLCIEPWCGIADSVNASGELEEKEGIQTLSPNGLFERTWSVALF